MRHDDIEVEAERIARSTGMSLGLARRFVTVDMAPEEERRLAEVIRKRREAKQDGRVRSMEAGRGPDSGA